MENIKRNFKVLRQRGYSLGAMGYEDHPRIENQEQNKYRINTLAFFLTHLSWVILGRMSQCGHSNKV